MKITIHRGINQIGGCITEIATEKSRILIDLGQNLPDGNGNVIDSFANTDSIQKITSGIDAILYTHYHGDHIGLFEYVPDEIKQYIGSVAKEVVICKHKRLGYIEGRKEQSEMEISKLERMISYEALDKILIGDICITPFLVSHSAYDAYMFLIEAEGKRILHTGDFRDHGYLGKGLIPTIKSYIISKGNVDFLITEGTMLSRLDERLKSENELKNDVVKVMKKFKNVFVMCSSTDMERLSTYYAANKSQFGRPFVCDDFQKGILEIFSNSAGKKSEMFVFDKVYDFRKTNSKLIDWMKDKGFCMMVRATNKYSDYWEALAPIIDMNETVLIYSMWKEYINPKSKHAKKEYLDFISKFPQVQKIHSSGHASAECLTEVCNLVNPSLGIIPIHSEKSNEYIKLDIKEELKSKIIVETRTVDGVTVEI